MQVGTTSPNKGWHLQLKTMLGLGKNQNSHYSLAGVIEDCARTVDNRYVKGKRQWTTKQIALTSQYAWLKKFFPTQIILADNLSLAEKSHNQINALSLQGECDCKLFRKWNLPCDHMLEQYIFGGDAMEPNWDKYASTF